ncbi:SLAP domain-containing protein [Schleiferilactobacillus harbinensis]|uniref:SLAP domain-containing protein n=1 Tax=Schleiferilactobacillus harbinensis TaxID=304207 RepID=A0ABU7T1B4_9LACO
MKKFSKVKYFGAVAAALLAVAPIAAPVVSQVASPAVAQAAAADNYADALNNSFANTSNITLPAKVTGAYFAATADKATTSEATADGTLGAALLKQGVKPDSKLDSASLRFVFTGLETYNADKLATQLSNSATKTYTVTIYAYDGANQVASKTVTVNIADSSKATVKGSTVKIGDNVSDLLTQTSLASAVTLQDRNGNSISLTGADFEASTKWATTVGGSGADLSTIKFYENKPAASTDGKWANPGQLYQVSQISNPASAKFSSVNWAQVAKASNGLVTVEPSDGLVTVVGSAVGVPAQVYVYRPVTVQTGNNDQQFYPVVDYTYAPDSADAAKKIVSYTNGQTVELNASDAASLHFYPAAQGTSYESISAKLKAVLSSNNFVARQDATVNSKGEQAGPATVDYDKYFGADAVKSAIGSDLYKAGTYNVPVQVTNKAGLSTTVNVPVTIGYAASAPVAVSFTPYTEITKGSAFDKFAGIQFQNSASDKTVIPESSVSVSGDVDTTTPGTYTLTYTVKNTQGNTSTFTRTVVVKDGALTESNADGVVYINKADGAKIYSDQATTSATDKTLDNTTAWKFHSVVKDSAGKIVAYNLGGKQYVKASEVSTSPVKSQAGVFTVHYPANAKWSIAVYNSNLKVQKLIPAKSTWLTFGTKTLKDGKSYYNLGGNQWVRTDYGFWNAK